MTLQCVFGFVGVFLSRRWWQVEICSNSCDWIFLHPLSNHLTSSGLRQL